MARRAMDGASSPAPAMAAALVILVPGAYSRVSTHGELPGWGGVVVGGGTGRSAISGWSGRKRGGAL